MSLQYVEDFSRSDAAQGAGQPFAATILKWHPHGAVIAGTSEGKLLAWEATTGQSIVVADERIHPVLLTSITISDDGARMLTSSFDGTIALWDTTALAEKTARIRSSSSLSGQDASSQEGESSQASLQEPTSEAIVLVKAVVLQTQAGLQEDKHGRGFNGSDADTLARVRIDSIISATAIHPTKDIFASTGFDGNVCIQALEEDRFAVVTHTIKSRGEAIEELRKIDLARRKEKTSTIGRSIAFNARGDLVAVGTQSGVLFLYDMTTQERVAVFKPPEIAATMCIRSLAFAKDDRLFVGCDNGTVSIHDVISESHGERVAMSQSQSQSIGNDVAAARQYAESFQASEHAPITDASTMHRVLHYVRHWTAHTGFVTAIKLSEDERLAATSDMGGRIKLWDLAAPSQSPVWTTSLESGVNSLEWQKLPIAVNEEGESAVPSTASLMTAAASSARAAARFITADADGNVRWFRAAGSGNA